MLRAIFKNGAIEPVEPLPAEWNEGLELVVEPASTEGTDSQDPQNQPGFADRWFDEMEALCASSTPEEEAQLEAALREIRQQGKELMRKEMGL